MYEYENVGEVVVDNNISYSDFLDFWIENDCKNTCKEQTIKGYEQFYSFADSFIIQE